MKKSIYLCAIILLLGHINQAQERPSSPWFPEAAEWYYGSFPIESPGGTDCIHMTVTKDTLLADRLCRQLKLEACDGAYETLYEYVYPCGDSLFYYNYAAQDFFLLMDMSAKKGDTIWVHDTGFIPNPGFDPYQRWNDHYSTPDEIRKQYCFLAYKIIGTDTVVIGGKSLRRQRAEPIYSLKDEWRTYWVFPSSNQDDDIVENIGSLGGFWGVSAMISLEREPLQLRCFFAEGKTYMTDGKCDNAAVETSLENPASFWRLSPQPASEIVRAVCEASAVGTWRDGRWRLVDAAGKALQGGVFTDGCFEINLSDCPTGLYFVEIMAADGTACRLKYLKATR